MMSSMTVFHKPEMYEDFQRQTDRISEEGLNFRCKHDQKAIHMRTKMFRNEFRFPEAPHAHRSSIVISEDILDTEDPDPPAQTAQPGINH